MAVPKTSATRTLRASGWGADCLKPGKGTPLPEPVAGSVYGFLFPFGDRSQRKHHPGIVIAMQPADAKGHRKVLSVAVSHAEQPATYDPRESILVPPAERIRMGLDAYDQWVCLKELGRFTLPVDAKPIYTLNTVYLGQASPAFLQEVLDGVLEISRRRSRG